MKRLALLAVLASACGTTTSNPDGGSNPPAATYTIGGSILTAGAAGLVLATSGEANFTIPLGASTWAFATAVASGRAYSVSVVTQPSGQTCTLANASGTVGAANVTNVNVSCTATPASCANPPCFTVGIDIMNAGGSGMVVSTPGQPDITVPSSYSPDIQFANEVSNGTAYDVVIVTQPPAGNFGSVTCTVATSGPGAGMGTVNGADVLVGITCAIQLP